jgi:hypothetical protein
MTYSQTHEKFYRFYLLKTFDNSSYFSDNYCTAAVSYTTLVINRKDKDHQVKKKREEMIASLSFSLFT